ncbi:hypothetical protein FJ364_02320 [Candidatus Dependentiae bacterium]|nr:hypothetical protein [Candidatus Dependentiae bacterium]
MKKQPFLKDYIKIADIYADRLTIALTKLQPLIPFSVQQLQQQTPEQLSYTDMLTTRFGKLQAVIGAKVFPLVLDCLKEDALAFIDTLNRLEKLGYLESVAWWLELREIRNAVTHDYPDDVLIYEHLNALIPKAHELLSFWERLKKKVKLVSE